MGGAPRPRNPAGRLQISFLHRQEPAKLAANESPTGPAMNAHSNPPVELTHEDVLRIQLEVLRREHRDLDDAIHALAGRGLGDQLAMVRLKKQKLALKDQIARIEDQLTPDIIA